MKNKWSLLGSMLKIGCIGFGGGSALIPVIEREVIGSDDPVEESKYDQDVIVASITPGALPVEIAAGIGKRSFGLPGMVGCAAMMALPGALFTVVLLSIFSRLSDSVLSQIEYASVGVTAFICCLLTEYILGIYEECLQKSQSRFIKALIIGAGVFALSCGKSLYALLDLDGKPFFGISTIHILAAAFFAIFYTRAKFSVPNTIVTAALIIPYLLASGKAQVISNPYVIGFVRTAMVLLSLYGLFMSLRQSKRVKKLSPRVMLREEIAWVLFLLLFSIPAFLIAKDELLYLGRGVLSTLMSFGGGDAYLTVADGMFVETGMIPEDVFYGQLITVANVLPGSILCKVLAGIGYSIGHTATGTMWGGYLTALSGFACAAAASGGIFCLVYYIYDCFAKVDIFQLIRRWIRPIIAGLLLTVALALIAQNKKIGAQNGMSGIVIFLVFLGIYLVTMFLHRIRKWNNGFLVAFALGLSLVLCNLLQMI